MLMLYMHLDLDASWNTFPDYCIISHCAMVEIGMSAPENDFIVSVTPLRSLGSTIHAYQKRSNKYQVLQLKPKQQCF